jgi:predicted nucleic acid-binding protein
MSVFVVDASVAIKWFVPEIHASDALRLRNPSYALHAPALFDAEMANIVWKKLQRGELTQADADDIAKALPNLPIVRHPILPLLTAAFDFACQTRRSVYDSLYIALAAQWGSKLVTADRHLVNALNSTPHSSVICWVEDL